MNVQLEPGNYIVAVSGGVDSMTLLHILAAQKLTYPRRWRFTVAHLNHGIREDAPLDQQLVKNYASQLGLPFVTDTIVLGDSASESVARTARYDFLFRVQKAANARAVITAHHQDDLLETAIINLYRGTDRRGMTAMLQNRHVVRPLTAYSKEQIVEYARRNNIQWREDSTNRDTKYTRNYIRQVITPAITSEQRSALVEHIANLHQLNEHIDAQLINMLHMQEHAGTINRYWFSMLPHSVAREVMAMLLRSSGVREYDRRMLERLVVSCKTGTTKQRFPVKRGWYVVIQRKHLALEGPER